MLQFCPAAMTNKRVQGPLRAHFMRSEMVIELSLRADDVIAATLQI